MANGGLPPALQGIQFGSGLVSNALSDIMKRRQAQQQMGIRDKAEGRAEQAAQQQQQLFPYQLQKERMAVDPQAQLDYYKKLQEGMGGEQQDMTQNPLLRGFFKKQFGFDPAAPAQETPQQRESREVRTAEEKEQKKVDIKAGEDLEKMAANLVPYLQNVDTIEEILNKKPGLTGRGTKFANFLGLTKDEDVGRLASAAQSLQAMQAHKIGQRGGYGVAKIVEGAKPDIGHPSAYNKGLVKDLKKNMLNSWEQIKKDYKRRTGQDLPYSIEGLFSDNKNIEPEQSGKQRGSKNMVTIRNPETGEVRRVTREEADKLIRSG